MRPFSSLLLLAVLIVEDVMTSPTQVPLAMEPMSELFRTLHLELPLTLLKEPKKLHGRFLHITDMHPDPHYTPKASLSTACHRKKPKKKKDESLYYGTPYACVER